MAQGDRSFHIKLHVFCMQVGGFVTAYDNLVYATVKGAGHEVGQSKPQQMYLLWSSFIRGPHSFSNNTDYPLAPLTTAFHQ